MNKQRLVILIIAILGMLSVFMPWVTMPIIGSVNGARGEGWFVLLLYAIPVVLTLLNDRMKPLQGFALYGAIIPGLLCCITAIWKIIDFNTSMSDLGTDNPFAKAMGSTVSIGLGLYIVALAGLAIPVAAFLLKKKNVN